MLLRLRLRKLRAVLPPTIKEVGHEATNELTLGVVAIWRDDG